MRSFRGVPYVHPPERIEKIVSLHFTHGVSYGKRALLRAILAEPGRAHEILKG